MKQFILTLFISFAVLMAQAQVRDTVSGQSDGRVKAQTAAEQDKEV
ncbi:PKD domain-containing protein, partial [Pontibacter sp. HJ8]